MFWRAKNKPLIGSEIESSAKKWLQAKGLSYIENNFRCQQGEIDLIMQSGEQIVFVEVRYRSNKTFGGAIESVNWHKQQKLLKAAEHFLIINPKYNALPCRFDVLAVEPDGKNLHWTWIKNAFTS